MYLSFGGEFLKTKNGVEVLKHTPISKVFFETDDNLAITIEEVYILASEILQINTKTLTKKIEKNLCQVTGWKEPNY
jgi:Tat protein secretion system quality control protein TatD with DNase activity